MQIKFHKNFGIVDIHTDIVPMIANKDTIIIQIPDTKFEEFALKFATDEQINKIQ